MIILYVTDAFAFWGGMERVLADKINVLTGQYGWDVTLLTINQGTHPLTYQLLPDVRHIDLGVRMHQQYQYNRIRKIFKRKELKYLLKKRLQSTLEIIRPDVIVCVKLDFVSVLLEVKGETPLVVESHTLCKSEQMDDIGLLRRMYVWSLKRSIRKVDAVVALTEGDAADWRMINKRVYSIPNMVHLNESGSYTSCEQKAVIYVGRFSRQKDIDSLLRIWEYVYHKNPDWRLDIYGEGELKEHYVEKIRSLSTNIYVYEPTADIMDRYRDYSILLLTSFYEPFGLVLPEAMSCGLLVVAFDCPYGPADIITDGVDGFLIKSRDIQAFADRVCQLIKDKELRRRMGQNGIVSSQRFRADIIMPRWINLFEKLLSSQ